MGSTILDWLIDNFLPWIVIAALLSAVIGLPVAGYFWWQASQSPTLTLTKSEWACTQSQTVPITTYVQSGTVMIPLTTYTKECHQWSRQ